MIINNIDIFSICDFVKPVVIPLSFNGGQRGPDTK